MVVTDDDDLADRARLLRSHGMTTLTWARHRGHASAYDVVTRGFNYRCDEVHAALGRVQLNRLSTATEARARIAAHYRDALQGRAGLLIPFGEVREGVSPAHHLAVVVLPDGASRDDVRAELARRGVQTSVHYPPIHGFTAYAETGKRRAVPVTDAIAGRILTLPLYAHMDDEQVELVIDGLLAAVAAGD